jgi:hypothetical protein
MIPVFNAGWSRITDRRTEEFVIVIMTRYYKDKAEGKRVQGVITITIIIK